ncbi:Clp1/GlmU family protein [Candidatus Caldatribacterium saccharofermentans]|uniref:Clp1/GlmU family protein n=1 Tax=Candidatus Caldatribacterium saccharofermentans TaxID=1454753 RepID=UPI003D08B994
MCSPFFPPRVTGGFSWPREWAFLEEVLRDFRGTIMVIAPPDRGKTTLVRLIVRFFLERGKRVGWVDADPGQSQIGPPTTIGASVLLQEAGLSERLFTPFFHFIGDTTPERDVVAFALATFDLVRLVRRRSDVVVLDTCGLFHSPVGYLLKMLKIRLIEPEIVLALGEKEEFLPFAPFLKDRFLPLPVPLEASKKDYLHRRDHRQKLFALYFSAGKEMRFPLASLRFSLPWYPSFFLWEMVEEESEVRFKSPGEEVLLVPAGGGVEEEGSASRVTPADVLEGLICGLFGKDGKDLGIGIIERVFWEDRVLLLWGVQCVPGKVEAIVPGTIRLTREGEERGRFSVCFSPLRLERKIWKP